MPSPLTQSIRPSGQGGDFTSLASWEAQNLNLVSLDSSSYAMIDGNWSGSYDTPRVQLASWTTDETHTITIECIGTGSRHNGVWDETKYKLQGSTGAILITSVKYVTLKGLQLEHSGDSANQNNAIWWQYSTGSLVIDSVIVKGMTNFTGNPWTFTTDRDSGSVYIKNSLFYNYTGTGADIRGITTYASTVNFYLYNNTFFNVRKSITGNTLFTCINNIVQHTNDGFVGTFNANSDYNISDITSDAPGANSLTGTVTFVDSASYNFQLSPYDTLAAKNGISLYTSSFDVTNDIIGTSRGNSSATSFDIGSFHVTKSIKTIKPSGQGGNYSSLSSWESGEQTDLVSINKSAVAYIDGDWSGSNDATYCLVNGWTTDSTHNITIEAIGQAKHSGSWDDTKYVLYRYSNSNLANFSTYVSNITLKYIQAEVLGVGSAWQIPFHIQYAQGVTNITFDKCIAKRNSAGSGTPSYAGGFWLNSSNGGKIQCYNCISYGFQANTPTINNCDGFLVGNPGNDDTDIDLYNCTTFDCGYGFVGKTWANIQNCLAQSCSVAGFTDVSTANINYCLSDDATALGVNSITNSLVTFVDAANGDFRVTSGQSNIGAGYDLYNNGVVTWNTDIADNTRTIGSWDIGATQFIGSSVIIPYIKNIYTNRFSSIIIVS